MARISLWWKKQLVSNIGRCKVTVSLLVWQEDRFLQKHSINRRLFLSFLFCFGGFVLFFGGGLGLWVFCFFHSSWYTSVLYPFLCHFRFRDQLFLPKPI